MATGRLRIAQSSSASRYCLAMGTGKRGRGRERGKDGGDKQLEVPARTSRRSNDRQDFTLSASIESRETHLCTIHRFLKLGISFGTGEPWGVSLRWPVVKARSKKRFEFPSSPALLTALFGTSHRSLILSNSFGTIGNDGVVGRRASRWRDRNPRRFGVCGDSKHPGCIISEEQSVWSCRNFFQR
jgi:hypothetical protein